MNKFIEKLRKFILENKLIQKGDKVIVGFSGGSDSTALIYALHSLRDEFHIRLIAIHINYHLRGNDSIEDEKFVKNFCFTYNIPILVKNAPITQTSSIESTARKIRFDFFEKIHKMYSTNKIALGHNANDQAETILMNLFRGTGAMGLKGIVPKNGMIIHPIIEFTKAEITDFLQKENLNWREDKSNSETSFSRNKIRNVIMPYVFENLNPKFVEKMVNTSRIYRETEQIMSEYVNRRLAKIIIENDESKYIISLKKIIQFSPTVRFYFYKRIYTEITGFYRDFYHYHFEEIEKILLSHGTKIKEFPNNLTVIKEYDKLIFQKTSAIKSVDMENIRKIDKIRSKFKFEDYRLSLKKLKKIIKKKYVFEDKNNVYMDLDKIKFPIILRHRQGGDKFIPLGMNHPKKIKDFFIDEKIPKFDRDKLLIIEDQEKIIWIAGYRIDNRVALTENTKNILNIKLEKVKYHRMRTAERIKS